MVKWQQQRSHSPHPTAMTPPVPSTARTSPFFCETWNVPKPSCGLLQSLKSLLSGYPSSRAASKKQSWSRLWYRGSSTDMEPDAPWYSLAPRELDSALLNQGRTSPADQPGMPQAS